MSCAFLWLRHSSYWTPPLLFLIFSPTVHIFLNESNKKITCKVSLPFDFNSSTPLLRVSSFVLQLVKSVFVLSELTLIFYTDKFKFRFYKEGEAIKCQREKYQQNYHCDS